jgi:uncharacterized protein (TIGR02145 family)
MRKLLLLYTLLIFVCGYGQGEQLYADGTATDQDGNSFEWINYGTQDWAIENAKVVNYKDGTPIPEVTASTQWLYSETGGFRRTAAWAHYANEPTFSRLYNWFAVMGIHDTDPNTPNKEFAPEGWRVPSDADWTTLDNYLIANGYNHDGTTIERKIAKAMSSNTGWDSSTVLGATGNNQSLNNSSGFNAFPEGERRSSVNTFSSRGNDAYFWNSNEYDTDGAMCRKINFNSGYTFRLLAKDKRFGLTVRFVRDASTASTENHQSNSIIAYPNPTSSIVTINGNKAFDIKVYDMTGRKVMTHTGNTIDMSNLSPATYIIKAVDNSNNEEFTYKVIKD